MRTRTGGYQSPSDGITFHIRQNSLKRSRISCEDSVEDVHLASGAPQKRVKILHSACYLDQLPDDILISILATVSQRAASSADLINTMLVCRRICALATHEEVLACASPPALSISAHTWSDGAHRFLRKCAQAGNLEACFVLGMIKFYCLEDRRGGASLMAQAAMAGHPRGLHALAIIHFNGSGGSRSDRDLASGVILCAKAAAVGHVEALRELGHCLQDGYGLARNVPEGRRLLLEANAREAAQAMAFAIKLPYTVAECQRPCIFRASWQQCHAVCLHSCITTPGLAASSNAVADMPGEASSSSKEHPDVNPDGPLLILAPGTPVRQGKESAEMEAIPSEQAGEEEDGLHVKVESAKDMHIWQTYEHAPCAGILMQSRCRLHMLRTNVVAPRPFRPLPGANKFLVEWHSVHGLGDGLRLCSNDTCGRPETRKQEFRCCSACGKAKYCSRACQAYDWKAGHKVACPLMAAMGMPANQ